MRNYLVAGFVLLSGLTPVLAQTGPSAVWVNKPKADTLPRGVTHCTLYSKANKSDVGYCLYLPPNYKPDGIERYPVIYNLHGAGGNELHSFHDVEVLDHGIRSGRWPAMIMVLPNGGKRTFYKDSYDGRFMSETLMIRELIPHIDQTCCTIAARNGRCIEGFSMGGRGSTRLAMKYPDMFCSLFGQAGNVPRTADSFDPSQPNVYPNNYLGPDKQNYIDNDAYELLKKNLNKIKGKLRIQLWCGTKDFGHIRTVREFHNALVEAGVDHTYMEIEGLKHRKDQMIDMYRDVWFDYHVESLRQAGSWKE